MRRLLALALLLLAAPAAGAQVTQDVPAGHPDAIVDLATDAGVRLVAGAWRYTDARIVGAENRAVGADLRPSGAPVRTMDLEPKAGARDFDDAAWSRIDAAALDRRRTNGRLAFGWYRLRLTIPAKVGALDPTGSTVVFEIVADDYAEVWVDGRLPQVLGQSGGGAIRGWNAPVRVVLTRDARPGQQIQLAVLVANGPLSEPPANFVWIRSATLDFHKDAALGAARATDGHVERLDPALDGIVARDARIEQLAGGFQFTEGPVWHPDGYLLFSDPNANTIYRWTPDGTVSVYRAKSGYAGVDIGEYHQPGSNGLALDATGRLTIDEHGRRRVVRLERNGVVTPLAERHEGRRLNSPNDLVYKSDGTLWFTDPPFGLPKAFEDARKELPYSGVYRLAGDTLTLVSRELTGPNGLAFSPDERFLYVSNWDVARKVIVRHPVRSDGSLGAGETFLDVTRSHPGEQAWDGVKVDERGNVFAAGPGGVWVLSPDGTHLGTIVAPETPANLAFGDADGRTLYLTARTGLYRIRLQVAGATHAATRAAQHTSRTPR